MIAKVIFAGDTRNDALRSATTFFKEVQIEGIKTNLPLFLQVLAAEDFQKGHYTTSFLTKKLVK
jgi:acetyl-CoA carboxylase biotin carboxylase subunit